jgi:sugar phosphate isomerase/epimerase
MASDAQRVKVPTGGWVLWAGSLGFECPIIDRLEAARGLDVQRFSVTPLDVQWAGENGITAIDLGRRIRDAGYDVVMDPIVGWYGGKPHPDSRFGRFSSDDTIRMSADLGAVAMNLIGMATHDASVDRLATGFADVCDRAAEFGAQAHLEFTPITAITDLAAGWDIVRTADRPNGGLMFDTWHFAKSTPDLGLLARIPGDRIFSVQVSDAAALAPMADIRYDTLHRQLPGDGVLDLVGMLRVLHQIGGLTWVGPEVISPEQAAHPAAVAAELADSTTRVAVARATSGIEG